MTPELLEGRPPAADVGGGDTIRIKGRVRTILRDRHGRVKQVEEVDNIITTVGRNAIVEQLVASPTGLGKPTHMEVGTSGTAAAVGDTTITGGFGAPR